MPFTKLLSYDSPFIAEEVGDDLVLDRGNICITDLLTQRQHRTRGDGKTVSKTFLKKLKKGVDKSKTVWYSNQARKRERTAPESGPGKISKKFEKRY